MFDTIFIYLNKIKYYLQRILYWIGIAEEVKKQKEKDDSSVQ